jgi:hypothetical protein
MTKKTGQSQITERKAIVACLLIAPKGFVSNLHGDRVGAQRETRGSDAGRPFIYGFFRSPIRGQD